MVTERACAAVARTGVGGDAFTSGFEGPWTTHPTTWDNEYFHNLLDYEWESWSGPGGHFQWRSNETLYAPAANDSSATQATIMMTSDVSLTKDDAFLEIVRHFADDLGAFEGAFSAAWRELRLADGRFTVTSLCERVSHHTEICVTRPPSRGT